LLDSIPNYYMSDFSACNAFTALIGQEIL